MGDILNAVGSVSIWISVLLSAVLGAVAGYMLQEPLKKASRRLGIFRIRSKVAADSRNGRARSLGGVPPVPGEILSGFFRQQEGHIDLAIYELSLRPDIPIMDLLYLEYLRSRLENGTIQEVLVVPWSGWRDEQNRDAEIRVERNLRLVFGPHFKNVTVVTAAMLQENAIEVFDNQFFKQVGQLGNSEFLRTASSMMGYRFRSYHDINQGHPETHQARSIVEHTVRGWLIFKFVEKAYLDSSNPPRRVGSLMWERELTKLLFLSNVVTNHRSVDCSLMLGASVTFRRRFRKVPLPTFEGDALTIFGNGSDQIAVIARKSRAELRKTSEVLSEILAACRGLRDLPGWTGGLGDATDNTALRKDALAVARSLRRVRALYGEEVAVSMPTDSPIVARKQPVEILDSE